jgi:magnesium transporter
MDAFASVISNNLNIVMKLLASVTIVMAIPTMISGLFGMNVTGIPFSVDPSNGSGFWFVVAITAIVASLVTAYLYKKDMF